MDVPLDNFNNPPTSGQTSFFPPPLLYWACGGYVPIVAGGGGNPARAYSQRIGVTMRTAAQTTQYQSLINDLAATLQTNFNTMAMAATQNYANQTTGLVPDRFCPPGGSLHNKTLLSWVSGIVRIFNSESDIQAFTQLPTYAGGAFSFLD